MTKRGTITHQNETSRRQTSPPAHLLPGPAAHRRAQLPSPAAHVLKIRSAREKVILQAQKVGALPKADFAASLLFKLEKAKKALVQLCYWGTGDRGRSSRMLRAVQVKDQPADKSGKEGLMLLQRGKAKDADEASCMLQRKFQCSWCLTEVVLTQSGISILPAKKIA